MPVPGKTLTASQIEELRDWLKRRETTYPRITIDLEIDVLCNMAIASTSSERALVSETVKPVATDPNLTGAAVVDTSKWTVGQLTSIQQTAPTWPSCGERRTTPSAIAEHTSPSHLGKLLQEAASRSQELRHDKHSTPKAVALRCAEIVREYARRDDIDHDSVPGVTITAIQDFAATLSDTASATRRNDVLEEAAVACEKWGDAKVAKWNGTELEIDAKSRAWDGVQCAAAIRALKTPEYVNGSVK